MYLDRFEQLFIPYGLLLGNIVVALSTLPPPHPLVPAQIHGDAT